MIETRDLLKQCNNVTQQTWQGDYSVSFMLWEDIFAAEVGRLKCQEHNVADKIPGSLSDRVTRRHPTQIPPDNIPPTNS